MAWVEKIGSRFRVGWMDPETKLQHYKGGFRTRQDAARFQRDIEVDGAPADVTLEGYAQKLFDSSFELRASTLYAYRNTWAKHVAHQLGRRRLVDLGTEDLRRYFTDLDVGPSARASIYRVVAKVLNSAEREGVIGKSPLRPIRKPRDVRRREIELLPVEDIEALSVAIDPRYRLAVLLAGYGGLRGGEIGGLRLQDVDVQNCQLQIVQATARHGGQRVLGDVKTGASRRRIDVPRFLVDAVLEHVKLWETADDGRLFQTPTNVLVVNQVLDNALDRAQALAFPNGRSKIRFHDLRHTCASLMIQTGAHPKVIQQHMGHSSITITLDVYGSLFPGMSRGVADALGEARRKAQDGARLRVVS